MKNLTPGQFQELQDERFAADVVAMFATQILARRELGEGRIGAVADALRMFCDIPTAHPNGTREAFGDWENMKRKVLEREE